MFKIDGYIDGIDKEKLADLLFEFVKVVEGFNKDAELMAVITEYKEENENGEETGLAKL